MKSIKPSNKHTSNSHKTSKLRLASKDSTNNPNKSDTTKKPYDKNNKIKKIDKTSKCNINGKDGRDGGANYKKKFANFQNPKDTEPEEKYNEKDNESYEVKNESKNQKKAREAVASKDVIDITESTKNKSEKYPKKRKVDKEFETVSADASKFQHVNLNFL